MTLLDLTLYKPIPNTLVDAGPVSNAFTSTEAIVNGAIDDSNVAPLALTPNRLKQAGASTGALLAWDGTQWGPAGTGGGIGIGLVSSLPGAPSDGQTVVYTDSLPAPTFTWQLIFVQSTGKWHFIGGTPLYAEVLTDQSTATANTYLDLATVGPQVTIPVNGDYEIRAGSQGWNALNTAQVMRTALKVGAAATANADGFSNTGVGPITAGLPGIGSMRTFQKTGLTATTVLKLQYLVGGSTGHWLNRWLSVVPIKIG